MLLLNVLLGNKILNPKQLQQDILKLVELLSY